MNDKTEFIQIRLNNTTKKQLQSKADNEKKSLTQYLIDAGLEMKNDSSQAEINQKMSKQIAVINSDINYLKQMLYANTKLIMSLLSLNVEDKEIIKELYNRAMKDAEKIFKEEDN